MLAMRLRVIRVSVFQSGSTRVVRTYQQFEYRHSFPDKARVRPSRAVLSALEHCRRTAFGFVTAGSRNRVSQVLPVRRVRREQHLSIKCGEHTRSEEVIGIAD